MRNHRFINMFIFSILGLSTITSSAFAYIPPASFLIKAFSKQHFSFYQLKQNFVMTSTLHIQGETPQKYKIFTQYFPDKRIFRMVATDFDGNEILVREKKATLAAIGPTMLFYTEHRPEVFVKYLEMNGIKIPSDEETESEININFDRVNGKVCWKLGNENTLWIEKDNFFPRKFLYRNEEGKISIFWDDFKFFNEIFYPKKIVIYKESELLFEEYVEDIQFFAPIPPSKKESVSNGFKSNSSLNSRERLELYFNLYK